MNRKFLPILLASVVALLSAGVPLVAQAEQPGYNFSPVNQYGIQLTAAYWNPIIAYVSEKSGVKLKLKIGRTSGDTTSYVLAKEVDFVFSNHLFSPEREKLGWRVFGRRETSALQGQIVVAADSPITELTQLRGRDMAFSGPEAFVVYKVTYAHLLAKQIEVKPVFSGNQDASFAQLFSGKVVAAGGNSQLVESYARRENKKFRVLWSSEPFQDLALMASAKVPEKEVNAVAKAFIEMNQDPKGLDILTQTAKGVGLVNAVHFIAATGEDYAAYRRFFQTAPSFLH